MRGNNKHIDSEAFRKYRTDEMTSEERNAFEKELQKDHFLAEALEGLEQLTPEETIEGLKGLSKRIAMPQRKKRIRLVASAASILLLVSIGVLWLQIQKEDPLPKVTQTEKIELPRKVQEKEKIIALPEPVSPEIEVEEIKPLEAQVETEKVVVAPTLMETGLKVSTIEKKKPEVVSEVQEESLAEVEPAEALMGKVQGISVTAKGSQPIKNASNLAIPDSNIRIRGITTIKSANLPASTKTLRGKVIAAADKMPLPGVTLVEKGGTNGTVTDMDGNFELPLSDSNSIVTASFIGMENKEISPANNLNTVIELEPNDLALEEVVVVGYGTQKKSSLTGSASNVNAETEPESQPQSEHASPIEGYKNLRNYLKEEAILPNDYPQNKVVVRLKIHLDAKGKILNFEKLNNAPDDLYLKARELILNGTGWKPALENGRTTSSFVTLRIVFKKHE